MKKNFFCPYCRSNAVLKTHAEVYGKKAVTPNEYMWVCSNPDCDATVHCFKGTKEPMGHMANKEVRQLRAEAHRLIDSIDRTNKMKKKQIYRYLNFSIGRNFHLGTSDLYGCKEAIRLLKIIYSR